MLGRPAWLHVALPDSDFDSAASQYSASKATSRGFKQFMPLRPCNPQLNCTMADHPYIGLRNTQELGRYDRERERHLDRIRETRSGSQDLVRKSCERHLPEALNEHQVGAGVTGCGNQDRLAVRRHAEALAQGEPAFNLVHHSGPAV